MEQRLKLARLRGLLAGFAQGSLLMRQKLREQVWTWLKSAYKTVDKEDLRAVTDYINLMPPELLRSMVKDDGGNFLPLSSRRRWDKAHYKAKKKN